MVENGFGAELTKEHGNLSCLRNANSKREVFVVIVITDWSSEVGVEKVSVAVIDGLVRHIEIALSRNGITHQAADPDP